jgi:pimeloyl-ACP methyl ester carboxylesterase
MPDDSGQPVRETLPWNSRFPQKLKEQVRKNMPTFVLVHGAFHGAWCWGPLMPLLDFPALAIDLPGRGRRPGDLGTLTAEDFARAALADIDRCGPAPIVLVGHSLGGLTVPRIAAAIPDRIAHLVFISTISPPPGKSALDVLNNADAFEKSLEKGLPDSVAKKLLCNDLDDAHTAFVLAHLTKEAPRVASAPVPALPDTIPRTFVSLTQDNCVPMGLQKRYIENLQPVTVETLDCGHSAMISQPETIADLLNQIARDA